MVKKSAECVFLEPTKTGLMHVRHDAFKSDATVYIHACMKKETYTDIHACMHACMHRNTHTGHLNSTYTGYLNSGHGHMEL